MIRSAILIALCIVLAGCHPEDLDRALTVLEQGSDAGPDTTVAFAVEQDSTVAPSSEEPAACVPGTSTYMWRYMIYDSCTNEYLYTMD